MIRSLLLLLALSTFTLSFAQPANDDCNMATPLTVDEASLCTPITISTIDATDSGVPHACAGYQGRDVWASFIAPAGGAVHIETRFAGELSDAGMALYSGTCSGLTQVDCDDDDGLGAQSLIMAEDLIAGDTYYLAVWPWGSNFSGLVDICLYLPPTCPHPFDFDVDSLASDLAIIDWEAETAGTTYTIEYGPEGFTPGSGEVVTGVVGTDGPPVTISGLTAATTYDYYFQDACGPADFSQQIGPFDFTTLESCFTLDDDDFELDTVGLDLVIISWPIVNLGATYSIEFGMEGFTPGTGDVITGETGVDGPPVTLNGLTPGSNYEFYFQEDCIDVNSTTQLVGPLAFETESFPPAYDDLCNAAEVIVNAPPSMWNNEGATLQEGEMLGSCFVNFSADPETIWLSFVAPASGQATVTTDFEGTEFHDTQVAVYTLDGDCANLSNLTEVGCDDDGGNVFPGFASVINLLGLEAGVTYYIQVDGYNSDDGDFLLQITSTLVGLTESDKPSFSIRPNPSTGWVTLDLSSIQDVQAVEVIDLQGRISQKTSALQRDSDIVTLDLNALTKGVYVIRLVGENVLASQRLILD